MKQRIVCILLCALLTFSMMPVTSFAAGGGLPKTSFSPFQDIDGDEWYGEAVLYVYKRGLMTGSTDNCFNPKGETNRAMIVTILWRLEGQPIVNYAMPFKDVPGENWYTEAIRWAASERLINGVSEDQFAPARAVTREELAIILYRYAGYRHIDTSKVDTNLLSYDDCHDIRDDALAAFRYCCGCGILQGISGSLKPQDTATRGQLAVMLQRFLGQTEFIDERIEPVKERIDGGEVAILPVEPKPIPITK